MEDLKIEIRKIVLPGIGRYPNLVVPNLNSDSVLGTTISIALRTHATRVHCEGMIDALPLGTLVPYL